MTFETFQIHTEDEMLHIHQMGQKILFQFLISLVQTIVLNIH